MSRKVLLVFALTITALSAQAQRSCQDALYMAQNLAVNSSRTDSLISDVDRMKDVSRAISDSLDGLDRVNDAARTISQIQIGYTLDSSTQSVKDNVQQAYNNNYNAQRILEGGLQKYEQALNQAGLADVVSHMRNALQTAGATESYIRNAQGGFDRLKQSAQQLDSQLSNSANRIMYSLRDQRSSLQRGTQASQDMIYNLVGSRYYWGSFDPDPRSKLGTLKSSVDFLARNACLRLDVQ